MATMKVLGHTTSIRKIYIDREAEAKTKTNQRDDPIHHATTNTQRETQRNRKRNRDAETQLKV